jgi:hypothetical protein
MTVSYKVKVGPIYDLFTLLKHYKWEKIASIENKEIMIQKGKVPRPLNLCVHDIVPKRVSVPTHAHTTKINNLITNKDA